MTAVPWGQWAFAVTFTPTSVVGTCPALPAPATMPAVGVAGDVHYDFDDSSSSGWVGFVEYVSGAWRLVVQLGPLNPMVGVNVPLTWDAGSQSFKCTFTRSGGPGFVCALTADFEWKPRAYMAEQVVRAEFDELTEDLAAAWSWRRQGDDLPGATGRRLHLTGNLWTPDHVRGLTRKLGTAGVPAVLDPWVEWTY